MSNQNTNQSLFSLRINENTKTQLRGAAVVAGVAAILALTSTIIKVVMSFVNKNKIEYRGEGFGQSGTSIETGGNVVGNIIGLIISILLFYFLNKFSSQTKTGLNGNNSEMISSGLGGLSAYVITIGILFIIMLLLILIIFAGAASGSR